MNLLALLLTVSAPTMYPVTLDLYQAPSVHAPLDIHENDTPLQTGGK